MLLLNLTTDKLQIISGQAGDLDVHVSFIDMTNADPPVIKGSTSGRQNTNITTATTTDVCAAPGSNVLRNIKTIHARNAHASTPMDVTVQFNQNGTLFELFKVTLKSQETLEYVEGIGFFVLTVAAAQVLAKILSADDAGGQNVATAQPWFPTQGAVTVTGDTLYYMEGHLYTTRAAGAVSHTTSLLFAGTATLTSISYVAKAQVGDTDALLPLSRVVSRVATATVVKAASTSTTEAISIDLEGFVRINAGGTFIPQFIYSAAPGGAPTIKANSGFRLTPIGSGSFVSSGAWS